MLVVVNVIAIMLLYTTTCCYGRHAFTEDAISISGSTTCLPAVDKAAAEFMEKYAQLTISVYAGGSGFGVREVAEGIVDIGMVSREINRNELRDYSYVDFILFPFASDAVVPIVSSEVYEAGITSLSLSQIRDIYEGRLRNWKELGGPDRKILVVDKEPDRGTRHVFMRVVFGDESAETTNDSIETGPNDDMQMAVATSDSAIGFISHSWRNADVKWLGIKVDGSVVYPTAANIRDGTFPISRTLYLVTNGPPEGVRKDFIEFVVGPEGAKIISDSGLVPLEGTVRPVAYP